MICWTEPFCLLACRSNINLRCMRPTSIAICPKENGKEHSSRFVDGKSLRYEFLLPPYPLPGFEKRCRSTWRLHFGVFHPGMHFTKQTSIHKYLVEMLVWVWTTGKFHENWVQVLSVNPVKSVFSSRQFEFENLEPSHSVAILRLILDEVCAESGQNPKCRQ